MNKDCQRACDEIDALHMKEDLVCDVCGRYGAYPVDDRNLCPDCFTDSGSCCPEFGKDDVWTFLEEQPEASNDK